MKATVVTAIITTYEQKSFMPIELLLLLNIFN